MSINDQYMISRNELTRYLQAPPSWCGYGPVKGGKPVSMIIINTITINVIWSDGWDILNEDRLNNWLNIFWPGDLGPIRNSMIWRTTIDKMFFSSGGRGPSATRLGRDQGWGDRASRLNIKYFQIFTMDILLVEIQIFLFDIFYLSPFACIPA